MPISKDGSTDFPQIVADIPLPRVIEAQLAERFEIKSWEDALAGNARKAVGVFTYLHPVVDSNFLDCVPAVRVISNHGVGVDHIDMVEVRRRDIEVTTTPGTLEVSVAELAMALMLGAARRVPDLVCNAHLRSQTNSDDSLPYGAELQGKTLGILGMGKIGLQIAIRAASFTMKVIYHNTSPRLSTDFAGMPVAPRYAILAELLAASDVLMICAPLNEGTRGIIGREELALMKSTAMLVNVARGQLVDTEALADALENRVIACAALDVTDPEPLPIGHRLLSMQRVYITPHIGSATVEARRRMAKLSVDNLVQGLEHKANVVLSP